MAFQWTPDTKGLMAQTLRRMCWIGWSKAFQISRGPKSRNIDCIGTGDQHHYRSLELLQYLQSQLAGFSKHIHFYVYLVLNFGVMTLKLLKLSYFFCANL